MSLPTASTPSPVRDKIDPSSSNSQSSNPDSSALCFESSFRLETPFPNQKAESEKHPKGKRKRTTSQDKTILETAYSSNPKPDKAARLDIVKRVSLNEKEVQIWFQNRRQNDRRKSRPLSPQEIEALRYGNGMRVLSTDPMPATIEPASAPAVSQNTAELPPTSSADTTTSVEIGKHSLSPGGVSSQHTSLPPSPQVTEAPKSIRHVKTDFEAKYTPSDPSPSPTKAVGLEGESHARPGASAPSIAYPTNRGFFAGGSFPTPHILERSGDDSLRFGWDARRMSDSRVGFGHSRFNSFSPSADADNAPSLLHPPSSSSSHVRLSLSLDGKAELISAQLSPPRAAPQPPLNTELLPPVFSGRTLQRSRSAFSGVTLPPISTLTQNLGAHFPPQFTRGRSRDAQAWESCCESDTRDELTRQAENESSGSAVAAISLMRSSSNSASLSNLIHNYRSQSRSPSQSGILQSNPNRRNTPSAARMHLDKKLGRAKLSPITRFVSLEASGKIVDLERDEDAIEPEKKKRKQIHRFTSPSGDSDKENWNPDGDGNRDRRRPLPQLETGMPSTKMGTVLPKNPRRIGRVLGDQDTVAKRLFLNSPADTKIRHIGRANTAPTPGPRMRKVGDAPLAIFEDGKYVASDKRGQQSLRDLKRNDDDVERFMRGEVSPSKRPDMDCIAGLLSLSQGNWR
ncbi:hypothetical protein GGS21DRAFT_527184 [Xylaria nigripes]|nr:hypothetical protein GGS21DRAFT_527184 [Xylaria nigripes]